MHAELAERIFQALLTQDSDSLRPALDDDSTWELEGRSSLAGVHRGPEAILPVLARLTQLHPIRPDAYDVMSSTYHAVLTTRLVSDGLDSDHAIIVVADEQGRLERAFQYVFDLYAFDDFFQ